MPPEHRGAVAVLQKYTFLAGVAEQWEYPKKSMGPYNGTPGITLTVLLQKRIKTAVRNGCS